MHCAIPWKPAVNPSPTSSAASFNSSRLVDRSTTRSHTCRTAARPQTPLLWRICSLKHWKTALRKRNGIGWLSGVISAKSNACLR